MSTTHASVAEVGGRRALIDAAVAAIEEDGLAGLSLRSIARRAKVSHATPAHHFGDKAGLFSAVALEGFATLQAAMVEARETARSQGPTQQLQALGVAYVRFATEHRAYFEVMFRPELVRRDDPDVLRAGVATFEMLRGAVQAASDEGYGPGIDVDQLALAAWSLVHGVVQLTEHGVLGKIGFPVDAVELTTALTRLMSQAINPGR